ncbi:MAG: serine O-acetyltransferase EpsC [Kiritimatiellia bacterium]|nr:serine O-acetyltransferase EpsC [Kiritimatiellia bacterium]
MTKEPKKFCMGDELAESLCSTVAAMRPLYVGTAEDRPDALLHGYPDPSRVIEGLRVLIDALLPGRTSSAELEFDELGVFLMRRFSLAWRALRPSVEKAIPFRWRGAVAHSEGREAVELDLRAESLRVMKAFFAEMPKVRSLLIEDIRAAFEGDPAAMTYAEVQLGYPGLLAVAAYRVAHEFFRLDVPILPRIMTEWTHSKTGADIHPGARIGHGIFIDHATGVVIGETCEIGNRVKIYQGVTLGAQSFPLDANGNPVKHIKRHPTVQDNVVIYANATILGGDTVIGRNSVIGGNVFLMDSVPPESFVTSEHAKISIRPYEKKRTNPTRPRQVKP